MSDFSTIGITVAGLYSKADTGSALSRRRNIFLAASAMLSSIQFEPVWSWILATIAGPVIMRMPLG